MTERVGISLVRVFDADRDRVWREWTEPERFADWFGGVDCIIPLDEISMDVRPGGAWRATMYCDGGARAIRWHGAYREVVPPERLVLTFSDDPDGDDEVVTVELVDLGDGRTEMRFEQRGTLPPEGYEHAGSGWSRFFDRVSERLATAAS